MRAIKKEPGKPVEWVEIEGNDGEIKEIVGGNFDIVAFVPGVSILCNECWPVERMQPNIRLGNMTIGGTILIAGDHGGELCDVPDVVVKWIGGLQSNVV